MTANRPWTDDEVEIVRRTAHWPAREVAAELGRAYGGVRHIREQLARDENLCFDKHQSAFDPHLVGSRPLVAKTCVGCGLLLPADWFGRYSKRRTVWKSHCLRCRSKNRVHKNASLDPKVRDAARRSVAVQQKLTQATASRAGFPWLDSDHEVLMDQSLTHFEKALKLHRTYLATKSAIHKNGYSSKNGKGDAALAQWMIDNPNAEQYTKTG